MAQVTVVIPCFNHGRFLDEAVDSVLAQTFTDLEIFVVNDGSTDPHTVAKLKDYLRPKTTVLHKVNGHLASARNHGIARAKSKYILSLDADDKFAPDFLEKAVAVLEREPRTGAVNCWSRMFGTRDEIVTSQIGGDVKNFLSHNVCSASCLFRRECWQEVGGYDEAMKQGYEDWDFWLSVTKRGWFVRNIPEPLLFYRVTGSSMVAGSDKIRPQLVRKLVQKHRELYAQHVDLVVFELELKIQRLYAELEALRRSPAQRLGRVVVRPGEAVKAVARRLRMKR